MADALCGIEHPTLRGNGLLRPVLALLVVPLIATSCSRNAARAKPPQAPFAAESQPAAEAPPQPPPARETPRPPRTVVIEGNEAAEGERPTSLLEASRRAKEQKRNAPPPAIVITNENLAEIAARGSLTIAKPNTEKPASGGEVAAAEPAAAVDLSRNEEYWRSTARLLRERWKAAAESVSELQVRTEALRYQFYSQEDTYVRDTRIKPAWDRALDQLEEARRETESAESELEDFLDEGRRAGALPGWLREGIELEPEESESSDEDLPEANIVDPVTIDEDDGSP